MTISKDQVTPHENIIGRCGLSNITLTGLDFWRNGVVVVMEMAFTGGTATSPFFLKFRQGLCEFGGTAEWNSGTKL